MPRKKIMMTERTVELYITTDKAITKKVKYNLIETLIINYKLNQSEVISRLNKAFSRADTNKNEFALKSAANRYLNTHRKRLTPLKRLNDVYNLKLNVSDVDLKEGKPEVYQSKVILKLDVKDDVIAPWYKLISNFIGKLESLLNNNKAKSDEIIIKLVETIKECSPKNEQKNIDISVSWYRKNIKKRVKALRIKQQEKKPFNAELFLFEQESQVIAYVLVSFFDAAISQYIPFKITDQARFLEYVAMSSDEYQIFVTKEEEKYTLNLKVTNPNDKEENYNFKTTILIPTTNSKSTLLGSVKLVDPNLSNETYTLTEKKTIKSSQILTSLEHENIHHAEITKTLDTMHKHLSLSHIRKGSFEPVDMFIVKESKNNEKTADVFESKAELRTTNHQTYLIELA